MNMLSKEAFTDDRCPIKKRQDSKKKGQNSSIAFYVSSRPQLKMNRELL